MYVLLEMWITHTIDTFLIRRCDVAPRQPLKFIVELKKRYNYENKTFFNIVSTLQSCSPKIYIICVCLRHTT